jgi:hypothetical protein
MQRSLSPVRGNTGWIVCVRGVKGNGRLSFGFRCDKEMKPNHLGFNLNFDEISAFQVSREQKA